MRSSVALMIVALVVFGSSLLATTVTWTGATDTDWHTASNWDLNIIPDLTTDVIISDVSGGSGNNPVFTVNAQTRDLHILAGGLLTAGAPHPHASALHCTRHCIGFICF